MFEVEEVGHGDESMAVKPYLGAIREPKNHNKIDRTAPNEIYEIDFVYGYKCEEVRQNLLYNANKKPVYMTAAIGVILDPRTRTQLIFGGGEASQARKQEDKGLSGHTDDISCLAMTLDRKLIATGQVGVAPYVFIWDALTAEKVGHYCIPKGARAITAIAFNRTSEIIACADFSNDHKIYCFKWQQKDGGFIVDTKSGPNKIFMIDWSLKYDNQFVSVGLNQVSFWNTEKKQGTQLKPRGGSIGMSDQKVSLLCVAHDLQGTAYCGSSTGQIFKFVDGVVKGEGFPIHSGVIHCMKYLSDFDQNKEALLSGATDNVVQFTDPATMTKITQILVEANPRSLDF